MTSEIGASSDGSIVAIDPLAPLVTLLRLDRQGGDRAGLEPLDRDRLAGLLAIAVGAVLDALQRRVDLGDQLALAVARAKLDRAVGLRGGAVGEVGMVLVLVLKMLERLLGFLQDVLAPREQLAAEVLPLALVHERLFLGRPVRFFFFHAHAPHSVHSSLDTCSSAANGDSARLDKRRLPVVRARL